ncbi:MAG: hypothetical protein Q9163_003125 [Psora crenata]
MSTTIQGADEYSPSGSNFSASDSSVRRRQPQKRKLAEQVDTYLHSRVKRLKPHYNDRYRRLFNASIEDVSPRPLFDGDGSLGTSQVGISIWSPEEKCCLLHALARNGRHNIRRIATAVQTKSELEVHAYLRLLRRFARKRDSPAVHRKDLFEVSQIEAALEISPDCEAALEKSADALSVLQFREEEKIEKQRYPRLWLLIPTTAKWADQCLQREGDHEEIATALPAAKLLNLRAFLQLSKVFFMNSSEHQNNWRSLTEKRKAPSMMYTAFSDLHTLALSLTKRVIQSSLFFAMSRIRLETTKHAIPRQAVRSGDVLAALNVLGLETNANRIWIQAARKFRLRVYENVRYKRAWGKRYSYDEVEQILSTPNNRRGRYRSKTREPSAQRLSTDRWQPARSPETESEPEVEYSDPSVSGSSISTDQASTHSNAAEEDYAMEALDLTEEDDQLYKKERQGLLLDTYLESIDRKASQAEERRLWEMLGIGSTGQVDTTEIKSLTKPTPPGKTNEDLDDWTDWVDYAAEWETLETLVPVESFISNRSIGNGKRRESTVSSAREESDEDDDRTTDGSGGSEYARFNNEPTENESEDSSGLSDDEMVRTAEALPDDDDDQTQDDSDD